MENLIVLVALLLFGGLVAYIVWPKKPPVVEEPSPAEKKTLSKKTKAKPKVDLTTLKKAELKDLCAKQGIDVKANDTKAVLIQKLES